MVYRVRHPLFDCAVAVKFVLADQDGDAAEQYAAIEHLHTAFNAGDGYRTPRPFLLIPDKCVFIQEWIEGRSLKDLLFASRTTADELQVFTAKAALWLCRLHQTETLGSAPMDFGRLMDMVGDAGGGGNPVVRRALRLLAETAPTLAGGETPTVLLHGDFKPANILFGDRETVAIDFTAKYRDANVGDLGHFLNCLALHTYEPRGLRLIRHRRALETAFVSGYVAAGGSISVGHLRWYRLHHMIRVWSGSTSWPFRQCCLGEIVLLSRALRRD